MIGGVCAYLGVFLILKRIVFVGAAISQLAAVGVVTGHLIGHWIGIDFEHLAFLFTIFGALIFWKTFSEGSITKESLIGYVYVFAASMAIVIISKDPMAEAENLDLFSGNILFIGGIDLVLIAAICCPVFITHMVFYKEFIFVSFDPSTARTLGLPARLYDFLFYFTLGAVISVGIRSAGMLFIFSSLILPAMTGLVLCRRMKLIFITSAISIWLSVIIGIIVSYTIDLPTGPTISIINGIILMLSFLVKRFAVK